MHYWPHKSQNTACLTSLGGAPSPVAFANAYVNRSLHLEIRQLITKNRVSPSVYVVFESIKASDGCNQIGPAFAQQTATLPAGVLSTIAHDGATRSFNFADLPCPPASIPWDGSSPYKPRIAPPSYLKNLDPAFANCIAGEGQGVDPPIPFPPGSDTGYKRSFDDYVNHEAIMHAKPHPHARAAAWAPQQTA